MLYGFPARGLFIVGVTGTDGKSTTANLIHQLLNKSRGDTLLVSTINIKIGETALPNASKMTSFDPFKLQAILKQAKRQGCKYAVLEVASHGIDQHRFLGVHFDMGVLTNITSDHLDRHGSKENYVATKKKLFKQVVSQTDRTSYAVFPKDDQYGRAWYHEMGFDKSINYSISSAAGLKATQIEEGLHGTNFTISYLGDTLPVSLSLLGRFNVQNALAAIASGIILGIDLKEIIRGIESFPGLSGRLERDSVGGRDILIDYAHTANGTKSVLSYAKKVKKSHKLIHVFGAPGERDQTKRSQMGTYSDAYADVVILTDDDPAGENRYDILFQIAQGINRKLGIDFFIIPDRKRAIDLAYVISNDGDIILITGKGHETVQLSNFGKILHSDKEYVVSKRNKLMDMQL